MNSLLTSLLLVTPVLLVLAMGIVGFVLRYQRRLLQQQEQLRYEREQAQHQSLEAALLAQEEERRRIAADLHDAVGTMLSIVKLHLSALPETAATFEMTAMLDQAISEVRRISRNLLPAVLEKFGLAFAAEALCRAAGGGTTRVLLHQTGDPRRLLPHHELAVYRVVQELLGNGLKHAQARQIDIRLNFDPDRLSVEYADDGVGFDLAVQDALPAPGARAGLGLTNLRSRVALLRGAMRHESAPGAGTRVWISFPAAYLPVVQAVTPAAVAVL
ncbi:sensor histidine kinase [Hymenobacter busanensis]|uniref:Oxygen sensor histidine kinase NreB n=1 Tax=Hymenobacter busanensis TaxID=2607656 RepID=A0A7L4ZW55_9BACT|nr:sensor histidine kinase [Hymenobacter busanensis]KAA9332396.1 sensor histidine kinase [Hymenobacter busanensis]QHJ07267.1 sensor histidine kinase [Hymenobacter busanensis]